MVLAAKGIEVQNCFIDLNDKNQWLLDFNGGFVPVLENTDGTLIPESGIITSFALEFGGDKGAQLIPEDPFVAAKMRVEMNKFDKTIKDYFAVVISRYEDEEKINTFVENILPKYEEACTNANGKYLMGTDDVTFIDIYVAGIWDTMFTGVLAPAHADGAEKLDLKNRAPNWWAYMERIREHPELKKAQ
jgi:glutathione S-transferase